MFGIKNHLIGERIYRQYLTRAYITFSLFAAAIITGIVGYMMIEDLEFIEAFYNAEEWQNNQSKSKGCFFTSP